jgi:predicted RNase H-like HicB family nuclease
MSRRVFSAYVEYDPETGLYVGIIPSLPGAHSQGATLDELQRNLQEVVALCLEEKAAAGEPVDEDTFVGIQQIAVNA